MRYSVRPVAFRPEWVEEFGDMQTAIFFQQLFYWEDKGKLDDGWVFKTIDDFEFETTLSKDQQKRCRERLVSLGYIEIKKKKAAFGSSVGAPVLHFRIINYPANALSGNPTMEKRETRQSSNTEITTESTSVSYSSKKKNTLSAKADDRFEEFWVSYPKKEKKKAAHDIWTRKKLSLVADEILTFVEAAKDTDRFHRGFIKQPTTFLSNECWTDDLASYGSLQENDSHGILK